MTNKREKQNGEPSLLVSKQHSTLFFAFDALLIVGFIVVLMLYISSMNDSRQNQNIINIENITTAEATLAESILKTSQSSLESIVNAGNDLDKSQFLTLLAQMVYNNDKEYQLVEQGLVNENKAFIGLSTRLDENGEHIMVSYRKVSYGELYADLATAQNSNDDIKYTIEFTNPTTGLKSLAVFWPISLTDQGQKKDFVLMDVYSVSSFASTLEMATQYETFSSVIVNEEGEYILSDPNFKSVNFFEYLKAFNQLTFDDMTALCAAVNADEDGKGALYYLDFKNRECVFVYSRFSSANWYCVSSVPLSDFIDDLQFSPLLILLFLILALLLVYNMREMAQIIKRLRISLKFEKKAKESELLQFKLDEQQREMERAKYDTLTQLLSYDEFSKRAAEMISKRAPGYYVISCFDIDNFKVINDQYGREVGDKLLIHIAERYRAAFYSCGGLCARIYTDHFTVIYPNSIFDEDTLFTLMKTATTLDEPPLSVDISIGRYIVGDVSLTVEAIQERALLAKDTVKGRYDVHHAYYSETMREQLLQWQEIVSQMDNALQSGQFEVWFQPQYSHVTKLQVGAEALVRWRHPEKGLISPGIFIPVFEQNGFIYELDKYVWDQTAKLLRRWLDEGKNPLPVSVNVSRNDIFHADFLHYVNSLVREYDLPSDLLRLEITESAFAKSTNQIISMVKKLRDSGFSVEIDDFGSGYSSLNILKDVPANILKLDIRFLENSESSHRGGRILESIVRMAKWLGMPVIAEGVETTAQADYLRSLGCEYIQGFLYARPMPVSDYEMLPEDTLGLGARSNDALYLGTETFWDPESIESTVFSNFSGGACIFEYWNGHFEMLRINDKFVETFKSDLSEGEILKKEPFSLLDEKDRTDVLSAVNRAIQSTDTQSFTIHSSLYSHTGTSEYVRFFLRMIASNDERYLFYSYAENITAEKNADEQLRLLNEAAADLLCDMEPHKAIERILKKTADYFASERVCAFIADYDGRVFNKLYEVRPDSSELSPCDRIVPFDVVEHWFRAFEEQGFVKIYDVAALSGERAKEREAFSERDVHTFIALPMFMDGSLYGFIGINDPARNITHIDRLLALGGYVCALQNRADAGISFKSSKPDA